MRRAAPGGSQSDYEAFASVAEHVKPSVVFIKSGHTEHGRSSVTQVPGLSSSSPAAVDGA
jgi:hypothetical protein